MKNQIEVVIPDGASDYLETCARIRGVHRTSLVRRLLNVIASRQLVGDILDDATHIRKRGVGEHKYKPIEQVPGETERPSPANTGLRLDAAKLARGCRG